jgi:hypothetical protein
MAKKTQKLPVADDVLGVTTWSVFLRTHAALVRTIEREVEEATGLPLSWYDVLLELNAAEKGRLRMQELAARVLLSRTRVSRLVDDIEARRHGRQAARPLTTDERPWPRSPISGARNCAERPPCTSDGSKTTSPRT